ncbi:hypothetical protein FACS189487_05690 [Campylobacterota bacterium]|nr:hypothetical protein FACS189487_05690 [Campylobacterota bacterium]
MGKADGQKSDRIIAADANGRVAKMIRGIKADYSSSVYAIENGKIYYMLAGRRVFIDRVL